MGVCIDEPGDQQVSLKGMFDIGLVCRARLSGWQDIQYASLVYCHAVMLIQCRSRLDRCDPATVNKCVDCSHACVHGY